MKTKLLVVTGLLPDGTEVGYTGVVPDELYDEARDRTEIIVSAVLRQAHPEVGNLDLTWLEYEMPDPPLTVNDDAARWTPENGWGA